MSGNFVSSNFLSALSLNRDTCSPETARSGWLPLSAVHIQSKSLGNLMIFLLRASTPLCPWLITYPNGLISYAIALSADTQSNLC